MATYSDFPSQLRYSERRVGWEIFHEGTPSWRDIFVGFGKQLHFLFAARTPPGEFILEDDDIEV